MNRYIGLTIIVGLVTILWIAGVIVPIFRCADHLCMIGLVFAGY